jgi:hypothetical protein
MYFRFCFAWGDMIFGTASAISENSAYSTASGRNGKEDQNSAHFINRSHQAAGEFNIPLNRKFHRESDLRLKCRQGLVSAGKMRSGPSEGGARTKRRDGLKGSQNVSPCGIARFVVLFSASELFAQKPCPTF